MPDYQQNKTLPPQVGASYQSYVLAWLASMGVDVSGGTRPPVDEFGYPSGPTPIDPNTGRPYGYQHGGSFVVPPGYPGDSFPIGVSSGEEVTVRRKDQRGSRPTQNILNIYTNAEITADIPDLLLLRAWANG